MGTRHLGAPSRQTPQQAIDDENYISQLAGSRAGPKAPQRHRGIWSFLVTPFVFATAIALQSATARANALHGEDQEDAAGDKAKHANDTQTSGDAAGLFRQTPEDTPPDQYGSSGSPLAAVRSASVDTSGESKNPVLARSSETPPDIVSPSGGGGGSISDSKDSSGERIASQETVISNDGSQAGTSGPGLIGSILPDATLPPIVLQASTSGIQLDIVTTGQPILADILAPVDLGTSLGLKDIIGFDVHLSGDGTFVAADLSSVLDSHLASLPVVNTVVGALNDLPIIDLSTPNVLNEILGGVPHSSAAAPLADLTSIVETPHAVAELGKLALDAIAPTVKLTEPVVATLSDVGSPGTPAPIQFSAILGHSHDGEPTLVSPGQTIAFPTAAPAAADQLFNGLGYTDYHVALQSSGTSPGGSELPVSPVSVNDIVATVTAPLQELPGSNHDPADHAPTSAAAPHPELPAIPLASALDELSLRVGGH